MINNTLKLYMAIGLGGMIGAASRYSISLAFVGGNEVFPVATLLANLIGCFLLTYLLNQEKLKQILSRETIIALCVGVIGAFTTFSSITIETVILWNSNQVMATLYILASIVGGLVFCYSGYIVATKRQV